MSLDGKIALVTGATRGIGKAIAESLAREGAYVFGTATSEKGAEAISAYLGDSGEGLVLNVTDQESIESVLKTITEKKGSPAILVNNAGITRDQLLMRMKDDEWNDVILTNLTSVYTLSKALLRPMMKARYGRIINISSVVGITGNAGQTNYAAAKAGVIGFTKSMAKEVGSRGITVNCVAPGFIDTDMTKDLPESVKEALLANIPVGRLGQPEEIAAAVTFLASDLAAYITGETINVNGGMLMD
ncbi:3-oxoacyl-ACP reductase FabG [Ignatzschineria cameli]|uniref:3-oxoacyl-[acyl-carrier-protein] reductase n=1 Tax=Ignatzschineria cameli TaxID=2182793 RepID=A0A2U2AQA5_9GAMM|nr:3-oxoacyl-ACP reductase FabG [Ignatzschineria cameli]PWD83289.1 3-oxoacyl-ACP reductase [Ignatzschineria cameli]PWD85736.1 3-oxoacyl-ACP reductase [Ignatzschineria cameli]PWD89365.1 3-oxoacyl-ACP reductase [Ignatzschineria cameli]PWD90837.1 3-oxoacyl-ACP reductase [Ignatzschineria cameli]PWD91625.1 3-oxoacyl-ACP reductase [Ignatzschineria cameli]